MVRAEDGSHLAASAGPVVRRCEVCGGVLGDAQWWVTRYPRGVHTACRDWSTVPFPFQRHLGVLARMRRHLDGEALLCVRAAERWLARMMRAWPTPGARGVLAASRMLGRLRTKLSTLGIEPKKINQL